MSTLQPNHICKWCGKKYYACDYCDRTNPKRSVSCSDECYEKYTSKVLRIRAEQKVKRECANDRNILDAILPERTDMSKDEVKNLVLNESIESVKERSIFEITNAGYGEYLDENGLSSTIDKINEDISRTTVKKKSRKTSKNIVNS